MNLSDYFTSANSTSEKSCSSTFFFTDPFHVILTVIRFSVGFLYILWIILATRIKEFHSKQMAFLYNLNLTGILYCMVGFSNFFHTNCSSSTKTMCIFIAFYSIYNGLLTGYSISAMALYRLCCVCILNLRKRLRIKHVIISIASIWLLTFIFTLKQFYWFNTTKIYFSQQYFFCLLDSSASFSSFIFFIFISIVVPNIVIFAAYIYSIYRVKQLKLHLKRSVQLSPPRITFQLLIYIILFEISCISDILLFYQAVLLRPLFSDEFTALNTLRICKWLHHISPLALLYTHPILLKKYRKILGFKTYSIKIIYEEK